MNKIIVMVMLAFVSACSSTPNKTYLGSDSSTPVQVTGVGYTYDDAKANAFNKAIEFVVGSVIVTEKESRKDILTKNDIINHSSGYVDSYKVLNEKVNGNQYVLTVEVNVKHSKIANRILNKDTETTHINGDRLATQYATYRQSRADGKRVLMTVLNDYPVRAFTVNKTSSEFLLDTRGNARYHVKYRMEWNYNYTNALNEALRLMADDKDRNTRQHKIVVSSRKPSDMIGTSDTYYFNDHTLYDLIETKLVVSTVVYAKIYDADNKVIACKTDQQNLSLGGGYILVQGATFTQSEFDFVISPEFNESLRRASHVDLGVTGDLYYCDKF